MRPGAERASVQAAAQVSAPAASQVSAPAESGRALCALARAQLAIHAGWAPWPCSY